MSVAHAHSSIAARSVPLFSPNEAPSSPRLRCLPPTLSTSDCSASSPGRPLDCPNFDVTVLEPRTPREQLQVTIPGQLLPDRGYLQPHLVRGELLEDKLSLRLYRAVSRVRLLDVGVWAIGEYAYWSREREHDFVVLDAVDSCLRALLPAGGGVSTFKREGLFGSAVGAGFSFRP